MARNDQIIRILTVAQSLARSRRGVSLKALAAKHGWAWRTLYRDVDVLEAAQFPVVEENGFYRISQDWTAPATPRLDEDELVALFAMRALAVTIRSTSFGRAIDRLWMKLSTGIGGQASLVPSREQSWFSIRSPLGIDYRSHDKTIVTFEKAIRDHVVTQCRYRAASTGEVTARMIEPVGLHWDPALETLYVLAHCRLRGDTRVFVLHRFLAAALTEDKFIPRPEASSKTALRNAFRVWKADHAEKVRVRFHPPAATEIRERRWAKAQVLTEEPDGVVVLTIEVAGLPEVERWILGFGGSAEVLEPPELVGRVRRALEAAAGRYEGGGVAGTVRKASHPARGTLSRDDNEGEESGGMRTGGEK